jgi:TonB family protein
MRTRVLALLLLVSCGTAAPQRWVDELAVSSDSIKRGDYRRSLAITTRMLGEMLAWLGAGEEETQILGLALTHKSLALAGFGNEDDALWYWQSVIGLYPLYAKSDLSMFGEPGALLMRNRELPRRPADAIYLVHDAPAPEGVTLPRMKIVEPRYPRGAIHFLKEGKIAIEILITRDGVIKDPRVLERQTHPALTYVALDAMREWRATPARKNGEPVDAIYFVEFIYVLG